MKCEATIRLPEWMEVPPRGCSRNAKYVAQGVALCGVHAEGRTPRVEIGDAMVQALREIAHGSCGLGPKADAATMQTIARKALGEMQ